MLPIELLSERFENAFKFRWPFSKSTIEVEWVRKEQELYLRPKNAYIETLWMCSIDQGKGAHDSFSPVSTLAIALKRKRIWRCCFFQGQVIFIARHEGIIAIPNEKKLHFRQDCFSKSSYGLGASFFLPPNFFPNFQKPQKYLLAFPQLIESGLTELHTNELSDYNQAKQWLDNFDDEWSLIDWSKATKDEVMALLRALYWLYTTDGRENSYGLSLFKRGQNNSVLVYSDTYQLKAPQILLDVINQYFQLRFVDRRRAYLSRGWDKPAYSFPHLRFSPPTMHEKIEALFLWREFLADKLPPDEIEAILPFW